MQRDHMVHSNRDGMITQSDGCGYRRRISLSLSLRTAKSLYILAPCEFMPATRMRLIMTYILEFVCMEYTSSIPCSISFMNDESPLEITNFAAFFVNWWQEKAKDRTVWISPRCWNLVESTKNWPHLLMCNPWNIQHSECCGNRTFRINDVVIVLLGIIFPVSHQVFVLHSWFFRKIHPFWKLGATNMVAYM